MRAWAGVLRWLLRAAPLFDATDRDDMIATTVARVRAARETRGRSGAVVVMAREAWDVARSVVSQRMAHGRAGRRARLVGVGGLFGDVRLAMRSLARQPFFTGVAVATLSIGIGANATLFGFVDRLLIEPLPYPDADRLVQLSAMSPGLGTMDVSFPDFDAWRAETRVFSSMAAFDDARFVLEQEGEAELIEGAVSSASLLTVLGLHPSVGRFFGEDEAVSGAADVVVLSHPFWQRRFGGDRSVIGREIVLNGRARTVIGIGPERFRFPEVADVWVPLGLDPAAADPEDYSYDVVARLAPGATIEAALAEGTRLMERRAVERRGTAGRLGAAVYPLRQADVSAAVAGAGVLMLAVVTLLLFMVCTNLAALVGARGLARREELAVRAALGASRGRLVRHLVVEATIITGMGAVGGLAVAAWATGALNGVLPAERPFWMVVELDATALAFVAVIAAGASVVIGLLPAMRSTRALARVAGARGASRAMKRSHAGLVLVQVASSFALLTGAAVLLHGLDRLRSRDPGIEPDGAFAIEYRLPPWSFTDAGALASAHEDVIRSVLAVPGVRAAGVASGIAAVDAGDEVVFGRTTGGAGGPLPVARLFSVTSGTLAALGTPLEAGRDVAAADGGVLVSRSLARLLFGDADPVGQRIRHAPPGTRTPGLDSGSIEAEIVGVVPDMAPAGQTEVTTLAIHSADLAPASAQLLVRVDGDPGPVVPAVRERLREAVPAALIGTPRRLSDRLAATLALQRTVGLLLGACAALAAVLAAIGIWGIVAYAVSLRHAEFAVRRALGARGADLLRDLMAPAARTALASLALGAAMGWAVTQALTATIPGIEGGSWGPHAVALVVLLAIGTLAGLLPARRALAVPPSRALRTD